MARNGDDDNNDDTEDKALWAYVTKSIKPLAGRDKHREPPAEKPGQAARRKRPGAAGRQPAITPPARQDQSRETDRRTAEKLRRGRMKIEARLDLHGMGRVEARAALEGFLQRCYGQGLRHVLVITGKALRSGESGAQGPGVLRRSVPQWLDEKPLRAIVLQFHSARRQHGGDGALYVLLRRKRPPQGEQSLP